MAIEPFEIEPGSTSQFTLDLPNGTYIVRGKDRGAIGEAFSIRGGSRSDSLYPPTTPPCDISMEPAASSAISLRRQSVKPVRVGSILDTSDILCVERLAQAPQVIRQRGFQMPNATVNGVEVDYEISGSGVPALFIHGGFGGPGTTLVAQNRNEASLLPADKVMTISYDRRGAGRSEYNLSYYTVADLAADARALLAHLGIDRCIIVGTSMGGMVAQQYALDYPQHIEALALINTGTNLMDATPFGPAMQEDVKQAAEVGDRAFFESRKDALRNPPSGRLFTRPTPEAEEQLRQRTEALNAALQATSDDDLFTYSTGMLRNQGAFIGFDYAPRLSEIKMPVCVVHGNADTVVPFDYGKTLHNGIPQSELFEIDGANHGVLGWPDAADAFQEWVLRNIATPQTAS